MNIKWRRIFTFENIALIVYILTGIFFLISVFNIKNEILTIIFGVLLIATLIIVLFTPMFSDERISKVGWVIVALSLVTAVIIVSFFIIQLPNENGMRDVFTAVGAASVGGFLTVYGVGLNIKCNRLDKREEEMIKYKPRPVIAGGEETDSKYSFFSHDIKLHKDVKQNKKGTIIKLSTLHLANQDISQCTFEGMIIDDSFLQFEYETVIPKNSYITFNFMFDFITTKGIKKIYFMYADLLENLYVEEIKFEIEKDPKGNQFIVFLSSMGCKYYCKEREFYLED